MRREERTFLWTKMVMVVQTLRIVECVLVKRFIRRLNDREAALRRKGAGRPELMLKG